MRRTAELIVIAFGALAVGAATALCFVGLTRIEVNLGSASGARVSHA